MRHEHNQTQQSMDISATTLGRAPTSSQIPALYIGYASPLALACNILVSENINGCRVMNSFTETNTFIQFNMARCHGSDRRQEPWPPQQGKGGGTQAQSFPAPAISFSCRTVNWGPSLACKPTDTCAPTAERLGLPRSMCPLDHKPAASPSHPQGGVPRKGGGLSTPLPAGLAPGGSLSALPPCWGPHTEGSGSEGPWQGWGALRLWAAVHIEVRGRSSVGPIHAAGHWALESREQNAIPPFRGLCGAEEGGHEYL